MSLSPIIMEKSSITRETLSLRIGTSSLEMPMESSHSAYMADFENIIAPGKEVCMTKEFKPKMAQEFERYHTPRSLKKSVLRSEKMQEIIQNYAHENQCPVSKIEKQVKDILNEIGLERNLAIIRWCGMAISAIAKRIYSGIYVNKASMHKLKQILGPNPVLYLPSHRSYMDFILMAYITFYYDVELPGVAAGMDFHSMFAMGTMLRYTGAFFMRRSFSNDELYWDVFREYMYGLVAHYHTGVEFFIEGTRSRNFKALMPKIGLLSMALLPYFTGEVSDVQIIPVSVSYERILEEQLFVYELLGVPKPKESTKGFFKAMKIIDEHFGKMYLDFGNSISVRTFFGHNNIERSYKRAAVGPHLQKLNKAEIELVKKLANEVIYQQQRGIVITTFNLTCLYFACETFMGHNINIDEITNGVTKLKNIFVALGAHVATDSNQNQIKSEIKETVEIHSNILKFQNGHLRLTEVAATQLRMEIDPKRLKAHALNPHTMAIAVPAVSLQLYINPCLFWLARPSYMVLAALELKRQNYVATNRGDMLSELFERVSILDNIFKHEFIVDSGREAEEFQRHLEILQSYKVLTLSADKHQIDIHENEYSHAILSALAPYLCIYYQLTITLNNLADNIKSFNSRDVLIHTQKRIEELLQENDIVAPYVHPYCLALDNITIALNSFIQNEYIIKDRDTVGQLRLGTLKSLKTLEDQLLQYSKLMPFHKYYEPSNSNVQMNINSKL